MFNSTFKKNLLSTLATAIAAALVAANPSFAGEGGGPRFDFANGGVLQYADEADSDPSDDVAGDPNQETEEQRVQEQHARWVRNMLKNIQDRSDADNTLEVKLEARLSFGFDR